MHEFAISCNIVEIVSEAAGGREVSVVTIEVGKLSCVAPEALAFCFEVVAKDTVLQHAKLDIKQIDGWARCLGCGAEFAAPTLIAQCPCGSHKAQWLSGQELNVKSIELAAETV